ncbi:MAG: 3-methyladenine DNA glycosylase AlkC [Saprospiraceae bacterium]|jgi:3-methyladenine DNA glycosylase AlkC
MSMVKLKIPDAPSSIQKGFPLKMLLDEVAIVQLSENIQAVYKPFDTKGFVKSSMSGIAELTLKERSKHIAIALKKHLSAVYSEAIEIILKSLTPPLEKTEGNGLAVLFYMPHCDFIAEYGVDSKFNNGIDPFDVSMSAQFELTKRFTCEYSIRSFIISDEQRTLKVLTGWLNDPDPHVRRLCSEGTRSRLPWSTKIDSFVKDPSVCLPILEHLKNDPDLYVRRSVANHVGDIAKDHLDLALDLCEKWLQETSSELNWVIRHAVRNPVKKGNERAIAIRKLAK